MFAPTAHAAGPSVASMTWAVISSASIVMMLLLAPRGLLSRDLSVSSVGQGFGVITAVKVGSAAAPHVTATMSSNWALICTHGFRYFFVRFSLFPPKDYLITGHVGIISLPFGPVSVPRY